MPSRLCNGARSRYNGSWRLMTFHFSSGHVFVSTRAGRLRGAGARAQRECGNLVPASARAARASRRVGIMAEPSEAKRLWRSRRRRRSHQARSSERSERSERAGTLRGAALAGTGRPHSRLRLAGRCPAPSSARRRGRGCIRQPPTMSGPYPICAQAESRVEAAPSARQCR